MRKKTKIPDWIIAEYIWSAMLARSGSPASKRLMSVTVIDELKKDGFIVSQYRVIRAFDVLEIQGKIEKVGKHDWRITDLGHAINTIEGSADGQYDTEVLSAFYKYTKREKVSGFPQVKTK